MIKSDHEAGMILRAPVSQFVRRNANQGFGPNQDGYDP